MKEPKRGVAYVKSRCTMAPLVPPKLQSLRHSVPPCKTGIDFRNVARNIRTSYINLYSWQGAEHLKSAQYMPVNAAVGAVVPSPGNAAPLGVLCLRVGAFTFFCLAFCTAISRVVTVYEIMGSQSILGHSSKKGDSRTGLHLSVHRK